MATTVPLLTHLGQSLLCGLLLLAPLPLCLRWLHGHHAHLETAPRGHALLALLVGWSTVQVGLSLLLGLLGHYHLTGLVSGELALLALGFGLWFRSGTGAALGPLFVPRRRFDTITAALLLVLLVMALSAAWMLLRRPTANFDSLVYHLPTMACWVREGNFTVFAAALYPSNWELLGSLVVLPLGEDLLVSLPNLLAWSQLGVAVYLLSRHLGASAVPSLATSTLLLAMPTLLSRLDAIQPDIAVAAFFVSGLYFGLRLTTTEDGLDLILFLACLAMLWGNKLSGPGYGITLFGAVLLARFARLRATGRPWRHWLRLAATRWRAVAAALPLLLLVQWYWYARNLHYQGNPLGMVELRLGGTEILPGHVTREYLRQTTLAAIFDPGSGENWRTLYEVGRQWLGLPFLALLLLAVAALAALLTANRRRESATAGFTTDGETAPSTTGDAARPGGDTTRYQWWILFALIAVTAAVYWFSPYSGDNGNHGWRITSWIHVGLRYGYPCLGLLAVAGALGMQARRLTGYMALVIPVATGVLGVITQLSPPIWALRAAVGLALIITLILLRGFEPRRWWLLPGIGLSLLALGLMMSWPARSQRAENRVEVYGEIYRYLRQNVSTESTIGQVNAIQAYPFFDDGWRRRVVDVLPASSQYEEWLNRLREERIEYLVVGHTTPRGKRRAAVTWVRQWLARDATPFTLLLAPDATTRNQALYRFEE